MAAVTITDLENAKLDTDHIADIATSNALTAIDRLGRSKKTLQGALEALGYEVPVAYAGGISLTSGTETIERSGIIYAPLVNELPFTTSGTWGGDDEDKFRVVQGITEANLRTFTAKQFDSVSDAVADVNAGNVVVGEKLQTLGYYGGWAATASAISYGGNHYELADAGSAGARPSDDGGSVIHCTGGSGGLYLKGLFIDGQVRATQFGAVGDQTSTDYFTEIQAAVAYVRDKKCALMFEANKNLSGVTTDYNFSQTLIIGGKDVTLTSDSAAVRLNYTGSTVAIRGHEYTPFSNYPDGTAGNLDSTVANYAGSTSYSSGTTLKSGGEYYKTLTNYTSVDIATDLAAGDLQEYGFMYERVTIENMTLFSATAAIGLDFSNFTYGTFDKLEYNLTASNAKMVAGLGMGGLGPYSNTFNNSVMIGGVSGSQDGFVFWEGNGASLANGCNANIITNIRRAASLRRFLDLQAGTGNLVSNIALESIYDAAIVTNDINLADSGTPTSFTQNTLTDTSKSWSSTVGDPDNFVNGQVYLTNGIPNECRTIVSMTSDTLTLDKPWSQDPSTSTSYRIVKGKAVKNMFVNIRQEGLASQNPDCIRCMPGSRGNEFSQMEIGSLGSGSTIDDQSQEQSNKFRTGDLVTYTKVIENPGPGTVTEVTPPRSGALGGIRQGHAMALVSVEMQTPNFVTGSATATLTVDHGGSAIGGGTESKVCIIDDVCSDNCYVHGDKVMRNSSNNGIFASLETNANVNSASDFIIHLTYMVQ